MRRPIASGPLQFFLSVSFFMVWPVVSIAAVFITSHNARSPERVMWRVQRTVVKENM